MSMPYPQDRHRDRKEKGEQPYKDAKERFTENEAEIRDTAPDQEDPDAVLSEEERTALQEQQAADRLGKIGKKPEQP
jgi:hypothetical protein